MSLGFNVSLRLPACKVIASVGDITLTKVTYSSLAFAFADGIFIILLPLPLLNTGKSVNGKTNIRPSVVMAKQS